MVALPRLDALPAAPKRIILHWTGGAHRANSVDRHAYHYLIEGDGSVVVGDFPIAANMANLKSGAYAAHTGGFNTGSIGIALAGMKNAANRILPAQVDAMCRLAAEMCLAYRLRPLDPAHVFTHAEAWRLHRVKGTMNDQKTDILWLPWNSAMGKDEVGPYLRCRVYAAFAELVAARRSA
jgi:N-acetyl-anhydromuramyl-L-alanine amidase AmpD